MLHDTYTKILSLANSEVAVREGKLYDLMYVNPQMADRQFAFLRKADSQLILVVVNFDDVDAEADVVIPRHAFEFLGIDEGQHVAVDLLTDQQTEVMLGHDKPVTLHLPPCGGVVLKITLPE